MLTGSCHCGKVRFEVDAEIKSLLSCNCSICQRKGSLLFFVPATKFKLLSGENDLKDYQFGKKMIHHMFCSNCGVTTSGASIMPDGTDMRAINARCIEGIELERYPIDQYDGKNT